MRWIGWKRIFCIAYCNLFYFGIFRSSCSFSSECVTLLLDEKAKLMLPKLKNLTNTFRGRAEVVTHLLGLRRWYLEPLSSSAGWRRLYLLWLLFERLLSAVPPLRRRRRIVSNLRFFKGGHFLLPLKDFQSSK